MDDLMTAIMFAIIAAVVFGLGITMNNRAMNECEKKKPAAECHELLR